MVDDVGHLPCFKDLIAVLFECFFIISLGYLSVRFKLISNQAKDLNSYLTTFALPMIIFLNITQMEFQTINLSFLLCMFTAKILVFMLVTIITLAISYPRNYGYAGSLSILATQSNDFALGYPLIKSLYGEVKPEMLGYLSLMAPIQLLILNPLGIALLEYEKSRKADKKADVVLVDGGEYFSANCDICHQPKQRDILQQTVPQVPHFRLRRPDLSSFRATVQTRASSLPRTLLVDSHSPNTSSGRFSPLSHQRIYNESPLSTDSPANNSSPDDLEPCCSCQNDHPSSQPSNRRCSSLNLGFLKALATNPLIIASVVALLVNLTHGPQLPKLVTRVSNTLAASFAAPALFIVGLSMYGKFELLFRNPNDLLLSSVLVLTKVLLLPNLMRTLALIILPKYTPVEELGYLIDFSFLYGLLPTAPTACIIAKQYGVLSNVVSISMLLSTFASAPLMLGSAVIINPSGVIDISVLENLITQTMKVSSLATFALVLLTLYGFWKSKKNLSYTNFVNTSEHRNSRIKTPRMQIFLFLFAISQIMVGFGGFAWYFVEDIKLNVTSQLQYMPVEPSSNSSIIGGNGITANTHDDTTIPLQFLAPVLPAISPVPETVHSFWAEPFQIDLGKKTLLKVQYVLTSTGLLLARSVILCMIVTLAAVKFKGSSIAKRITTHIMKAHTIIGVFVVVWLVVDSSQLKHSAVEPSLPSSSISLIFRLVYNIVFLAVSIPLFALIIRWDNKMKKESFKGKGNPEENFGVPEHDQRNSFYKHLLVTSSASLSSDTSSALTTNTCLDINSSVCPIDTNNNSHIQAEQPALQVDVSIESVNRRPINSTEVNMYGPYGAITIESNQSAISSNSTRNKCDPENSETKATKDDLRSRPNRVHEFNKYSILIVFMLIDSLLNLTSVAQKLIQNQPFGTYRQIEVIDVALEFGQGLLTFLVYRMKGAFY